MEPKKAHLEKFTAYLIDLAERGQCFPLAVVYSATKATHLPRASIQACRDHLIKCGRLVSIPLQNVAAIDGRFFGGGTSNKLEVLENLLRRAGYRPVCDARVVTDPNRAPKGPPTHLLVGDRVLTIEQARGLLTKKKAR